MSLDVSGKLGEAHSFISRAKDFSLMFSLEPVVSHFTPISPHSPPDTSSRTFPAIATIAISANFRSWQTPKTRHPIGFFQEVDQPRGKTCLHTGGVKGSTPV